MADSNLGTCPRCGTPFAPDDLAPFCSRCVRSEATAGTTAAPSVSPPHFGPRRRKLSGFWVILIITAFSWLISSARDRRPIPTPKRSLVLDKGTDLLRQGKLTEAIKEFRRVIKFKPREAEAHYLLAVALQEEQNPEEAIAEYRAAIELAPYHARAHHNLGVILADQGKLDEAIEHYRKAIQNKTDVGEFHANLASALEANGKRAEAIAEYRNATWYMPENPSIHLDLGNALAAQGNLDAAIAELRKARDKAQPGSEIVHHIESSLTAAEARVRSSPEAPPHPSANPR
jgi:Flp pilus assembly protein TadD